MGDALKLSKGKYGKGSTFNAVPAYPRPAACSVCCIVANVLPSHKRHRSSSSIAEAVLDGVRSERKLDIKGFPASIPEGDDQFAVAEARCAQLQDKIDMVRDIKKKRKMKKRSLTHMSEQASDDVPFIRVRTVPKKKVSQQTSRMRRLEEPEEPRRRPPHAPHQPQRYDRPRQQQVPEPVGVVNVVRALRRVRADGDNACSRGNQITTDEPLGRELEPDDSSPDFFEHTNSTHKESQMSPNTRRRHTPRDSIHREVTRTSEDLTGGGSAARTKNSSTRKKPAPPKAQWIGPQEMASQRTLEERPVLELFNKSRGSPSPPQLLSPRRKAPVRQTEEQSTGPLENFEIGELKTKESRTGERRRIRRGRRYELPTVASQMKQAGVRYSYRHSNHTDLPFVVSKSTSPSHNIGVNLQQVLNGLKIQQPLSGIPMTIAHHMGLRHLPFQAKASALEEPQNNREMNVIKVGRKLVRLPSYRGISYNRLLALYREGEGVVPRFLRAASRPHYFYTSMYNLTSTTRDDFDGSTSKGRGGGGGGGGGRLARQSLAEYASLYREYEQLEQRLQRGDEGEGGAEGQRRRDELAQELAAREEHIRRIVQEYDQTSLRASASTAEDAGRRRSTFKLDPDAAQ